MKVSVSLRSIIHSYKLANFLKVCYHCKFPSPYGVSFILMFVDKVDDAVGNFISFRLLTEYHSFLYSKNDILNIEIDTIIVSVSLRSIIHSYQKYKC